MGGGSSTVAAGQGSIEEQAEALYPSYFIRGAVVTPEDISAAKRAWNSIIEDESLRYLELRDSGQLVSTASCLAWFYDVFYQISEERDQASMAMYGNGMKAQVKALVGMVSMALNLFKTNDMEKISQTLEKVAKGHVVHIGVRAYQFPVVGEILLAAFDKVLGSQFDADTRLAWTKLISALMFIMIPAVLREEALLSEEQKQGHCDKVKAHMAAKEDQTFRKLANINQTVHVSATESTATTTSESSRTVSTAEEDTSSQTAVNPPATVKLEAVTEVTAGTNIEVAEVLSARISQSMKVAVEEVSATAST